MSEYQYYEFQAIDRPLTEKEMKQLRALSTRADISPVHFVNGYNWGDFRGSADELMETHFDAHLYWSNFGARRFMLRLPRDSFDYTLAKKFETGTTLILREKNEFVILDFNLDAEDDDPEDSGEHWLRRLVPLRGDLIRGDWRSLYLAWLCAAERDELDDEDAAEPLIVPGLGELSGSLESFAEFLLIDPDWIAAAAEASPNLNAGTPTQGEFATWVTALPADDRERALLDLLDEAQAPHARARLWQQFLKSQPLPQAAASQSRSVDELRERAKQIGDQRREHERIVQEQKKAAEKEKRLKSTAKQQAALWQAVRTSIETTRAAEHQLAADRLRDLRELAEDRGKLTEFLTQLEQLRMEYPKKKAFWERVHRAALDAQ